MKEIRITFQGSEIEAAIPGQITVRGYVDISDVLSQFTVNEIEENVEHYEKLFLKMKDYFRKVEERDEEFFK